MRVLLITWGCDRDDVSENEVSARWATELAKDHQVTLFAVSKPARHGYVQQQFPALDVIEWKDVPFPARFERFNSIVMPGYFLFYFRARRFLKTLLAQRKFDIVHHLSPISWRYPSPAAGLGVPLVRGPVGGGLETPPGLRELVGQGMDKFMFLRKFDPWRLRRDPLLRRAYRDTEHVLFSAPYVKTLLQPLEITSWSIEVEQGLADLPPPPPTRSNAGEVNLLYVGRVITTKGLRLAIRAFSKARCHVSATLTAVGDGADLDACQAEAKSLGLENRVRFLGWLQRSDLVVQYKQADVFVFPSFREPTGGVLVEAMANGLPVITCAYGGPDYMVDENSGIKVAPDSELRFVTNLAIAMDKLTFNRGLRLTMSENAYSRAVREFGWEAKRKRISDLYSRLVSEHPGTGETSRRNHSAQ